MPQDTHAGNRRPPAGAPPGGGAEQLPGQRSRGARAAKLIARAGHCSRREAEVWIAQGRVAVNGAPLTDPARTIQRSDKITIDGKPLGERGRTRLFLFHKPRGLVCTARDPQGRPTIFDHLREHWPQGPRVVSVGRLDINSEGLLLLTNDGGLARVLELPSTGWIRRYRARAKGQITQAALNALRSGATVAGISYAGIEAVLDRVQGANCWLSVALREGKNREIKRVLEPLGLKVNRLIRISYGPFQLGDLEQGKVEEVPARVLRDQLGPSLAMAAGADFSRLLSAGSEREESKTRKQPAPRASRAGRRKAGPARPQAPPNLPPVKEPKPPRRRRKHVSVLRAGHGKNLEDRARVERATIEDRTGRTVRVERRISSAEDAGTKDLRQPKARGKSAAHARHASRPERKRHKEKFAHRAADKSANGHKVTRPARGGQGPRRPRRKT